MKTISPSFAAHLAGEVTTLASCWKLTRRDGTVLGFTDHDQSILYDGTHYIASAGLSGSAVASAADMAVDNLDVAGVLDHDTITREEVLAGAYDYAEIELFIVNYADLSQGKMLMRSGWLGEVTVEDNRFTAEIRGLSQKLAQTIGEVFSPSCRAKFGDARCKLDVNSHTVAGTVTGGGDTGSFIDAARTEASGEFTYGTIRFLEGECRPFGRGKGICQPALHPCASHAIPGCARGRLRSGRRVR